MCCISRDKIEHLVLTSLQLGIFLCMCVLECVFTEFSDFSDFSLTFIVEYDNRPLELQRGKLIQMKSIKWCFALVPVLQSVWSLSQLCPQILQS